MNIIPRRDGLIPAERGFMKLWKVKANDWGWDRPITIYAKSREEAERIADKYPASDPVEYAGNYKDENAKILLGYDW